MTTKTKTLCTAVALLALFLPSLPVLAQEGIHASPPALLALAAEGASADARYTARWVMETFDNRHLPFVIVDKKDARMYVFEGNGQLRGSTPALLGLASGDHTVPGIGQRKITDILPLERTTPAGRFLSRPGRNLQGEDIIWIQYSEGLAIHRVRPDNSQEQRLQRLASSTPGDNRISLGCVVVPVAFYENVVAPLMGKSFSVVYVLPETQPAHALFGSYQISASQP
ncbi:L,D-transpeptidase [Polaromonas sp. A23]|uniref:L,D-transpeptidase n=1 Tax=Polaromonas sp. A23 TaxID=1944133 RepID=UPI000985E845|nr:L,D-transpeptidase [Polaromonas sp. A23]OOG38488.1 hypothetical protein B0B52_16550 [Polaromonas sp. A23]